MNCEQRRQDDLYWAAKSKSSNEFHGEINETNNDDDKKWPILQAFAIGIVFISKLFSTYPNSWTLPSLPDSDIFNQNNKHIYVFEFQLNHLELSWMKLKLIYPVENIFTWLSK